MTSMTPTIRPLRREDREYILPEGVDATLRGYVVEIDGRIVGAAGVMHGSPPQVFAITEEELLPKKRVMVKVARLMQEMLKKHYRFAVAAASGDYNTSVNLLKSLGFTQYVKPNESHRGLFAWRSQ